MKITRRKIRSVVLQALLLIFLAVIRTKADNIQQQQQLEQRDYYPSIPSLDPIQSTITALTSYNPSTTTTPNEQANNTSYDQFGNGGNNNNHASHDNGQNHKITKSYSKLDSRSTTKEIEKQTHSTHYIDGVTTSTTTTTIIVDAPYTAESTETSPSTTTVDIAAKAITTLLQLDTSNTIQDNISSKTATSTLSSHSTSTPSIHLNSSTTNTTTVQYTNTSDPLVQYYLECKADAVFCAKVSLAVGAAIDEFSRVINVKNSLLIKINYYSFCDKTCANDTLGWGAPTSQFTLPFEDGADLNFVYPQALAKQLAPYSSTSVWSKYDIQIDINHDPYLNSTDIEQAIADGWSGTGTPPNGKYWFFNGTANNTGATNGTYEDNDIQSHQVDFRYVVLHELLHGLGFLSSWAAYFWTDASPFRTLVDGVIDPLELQLVTPGPYWFINQETGPAYVTGFQPTMIFDKYLVNSDTELNVTTTCPLSELAFEMQDFCVQNNNNAFIVNFIRAFNAANQSTIAHKLWVSLSQPETLEFRFQAPTVANSSYNTVPYLNQTYTSMTMLTGGDLFSGSIVETTDPTLNRPGLTISHLDDQYENTPDFLMTEDYHFGETLEQLVARFYSDIPVIKYNVTVISNNNGTITSSNNGTNSTGSNSTYNSSNINTTVLLEEKTYQSPIGPGVLRILDSIGYSTVLTRTNYTTDGSVKTPKSRSLCDDSNINHGLKPTPSPTSLGLIIIPNSSIVLLFIVLYCYFIQSPVNI